MKTSVIEGTWDELATHAEELRRYPKLTLIVPDVEETAHPVNQGMLDALREIAERQRDRPTTSPENTDRWIREARDGGMYGLGPTSDE